MHELFDSAAALQLREQIAFGCRILHRLGVQPSHLSARLPDTPYIVVKTRGGGGANVTRDQSCLVDLDGNALAGGEPPLELALHLEIYRKRADVTSIGHTHQPAATSRLGAANSGRTDIPTYPHPDQVRTPEQGAELAQTLGRAAIVHLRDHGIAITGASIDDVVAQAVELEAWARFLSP